MNFVFVFVLSSIRESETVRRQLRTVRTGASYCRGSWMIHGTLSGSHRTLFVSAVSAPSSACSNNTLTVAQWSADTYTDTYS